MFSKFHCKYMQFAGQTFCLVSSIIFTIYMTRNILSILQLFPGTLDQTKMEGESPYNIMFGPDICGPGTKKVHVIFNYKGKNLLVKKDIRCKVKKICTCGY